MKSKIYRGQISLEYLLLLAISFSLLVVFISTGANFIDSLKISLEKQKAEQFIRDFERSIDEISLFADGSTKTISVNNSFPWDFHYDSGVFTIIIFSNVFHNPTIGFNIKNQLIFEQEQFHCVKCSLQAIKENGRITIFFNNTR